MLEMRPNCECCDRNLPPAEGGAFICTFECTFCEPCALGPLAARCPNCTGTLVPRPSRPAHLLGRAPGSTKRVLKPGGCVPEAA
jgi:hypothetical protein